jgi:uncharacterized protein (TIGR02147 family)
LDDKPVIYDYFNNRDYLSDIFNYLKATVASYSHRKFLADADIKGSAYLSRVLQGDRKLSIKYVSHFSKALNHNTIEAHFFELMVRFENEKNIDKKNIYLREMLKIRNEKTSHVIQDSKLNYLKKWYYPVIRDLVGIIDFNEDYNLLAKLLIPRINADQARGAVRFLLKNGFIKKRESGSGYEPTDPIVSTPPDVHSTILSQFHKKNLELDIEAFDTCLLSDRSISSVIVSVSEETYKQMRVEIQEFRNRLIALTRSSINPTMVYRIGFQMVPRAKLRKRDA